MEAASMSSASFDAAIQEAGDAMRRPTSPESPEKSVKIVVGNRKKDGAKGARGSERRGFSAERERDQRRNMYIKMNNTLKALIRDMTDEQRRRTARWVTERADQQQTIKNFAHTVRDMRRHRLHLFNHVEELNARAVIYSLYMAWYNMVRARHVAEKATDAATRRTQHKTMEAENLSHVEDDVEEDAAAEEKQLEKIQDEHSKKNKGEYGERDYRPPSHLMDNLKSGMEYEMHRAEGDLNELHPFDVACLHASWHTWCLWIRRRTWFDKLANIRPVHPRREYLKVGVLRGWYAVCMKFQAQMQGGISCFVALPPSRSFAEFIPRGPMRRSLYHRVIKRWITTARRKVNNHRIVERMCSEYDKYLCFRVFNEWYYYQRWVMTKVYIMIAKYQAFDKTIAQAAVHDSSRIHLEGHGKIFTALGRAAHHEQILEKVRSNVDDVDFEAQRRAKEAYIYRQYDRVRGSMKRAWAKARVHLRKDLLAKGRVYEAEALCTPEESLFSYEMNPGAYKGKYPRVGFHPITVVAFNCWRRFFLTSALERQFVSRRDKLIRLKEQQEQMWANQVKELEMAIEQMVKQNEVARNEKATTAHTILQHKTVDWDDDQKSVYSIGSPPGSKFLNEPKYIALEGQGPPPR